MSCTYFVYKIVMSVQTLYISCMYKMYTKYDICIQNVQSYVQNTYRLDVMVAVSFEQNRHHRLDKIECYCHITITQSHKINIFLTKCIHSCFSTYKIVTKYDNYISQCKCHVHILYTKLLWVYKLCTHHVHTKCIQNMLSVYKMCKNMYKMHTDWMLWWRFSFEQNRHHRLHKMVCFCHMSITNDLKNSYFLIYKMCTTYFCQHTKCLQNITRSTDNVCIVYKFCIDNWSVCAKFVYMMYVQNVYKICFLYTKCAKICTKYIQIGCYGGGFPFSKTATIDYTKGYVFVI